MILGQHHDMDAIVAAIQQFQDQTAPIGIGLPRPALDGASASINDATDALALSTADHPIVTFTDSSLAASLRSQKSRLAPLFTRAVAIARSDAHLAAAVAAFADHGLSVAAAARALHLHLTRLPAQPVARAHRP